ncbi:MAG: DNA phosphorothioation-associated protein 4 [Aestuariivita sp.]|nr:DNA phosphorothioation-associated protein 4 [Aestuariivita sp.]
MSVRSRNINRSRIYEDSVVQKLAVNKLYDSERSLFPTIRELLCFAALLGYSEDRRIPLDRSEGVEDVSYQQFERGDAEDLIYLLALAVTKDPEIVKEGREAECAEIFEEYANGGLGVIDNALKAGGGEYPDRDILEMLKDRGYIPRNKAKIDFAEVEF